MEALSNSLSCPERRMDELPSFGGLRLLGIIKTPVADLVGILTLT